MPRSVRLARYCVALAALSLAYVAPAQAQGKLQARYTISLAGISIGKSEWKLDVGTSHFSSNASGRAAGMFSVLISGEGNITAEGSVDGGKLATEHFSSNLKRTDDKVELKMTLDAGTVKELTAAVQAAPGADKDRIAITDAHRTGVVDPLTAMLVPVANVNQALTAETCARTLPIFDGRRRYDLKLGFKRTDTFKADKGYKGPAVVCSVTFQPIAGHRPSSVLVKYLAEGRDIELWLVPVAGTRVMAPAKLSIANLLGNLVIQATEFEATLQQSAGLPPATRTR